MLVQLIGGDIPYPAFGRERQNADLFSPFIDRQSASRPGLAARRVPDSHVAFQPPLPCLSGKIPLRVARRPGTGQLDAVRATPLMSLTRPHQRPPASPSPSRLLSLSADLERELQLIALPLPYQGCSSHV